MRARSALAVGSGGAGGGHGDEGAAGEGVGGARRRGVGGRLQLVLGLLLGGAFLVFALVYYTVHSTHGGESILHATHYSGGHGAQRDVCELSR